MAKTPSRKAGVSFQDPRLERGHEIGTPAVEDPKPAHHLAHSLACTYSTVS